MDIILSNECSSGRGCVLKSTQRNSIFNLISDWFEKLDKEHMRYSDEFKIKEIIIKPEIDHQYYVINIDITFNFILPRYSFNFSKERQITVFREDKKISQKDFDTILNEFLLNEIREMKRVSDNHQEAFEKMLSVL